MIDSLHKYPVFPDLLENQKRSLQYFWKKGILEELELFSYLSRSNTDFDGNSQNAAESQRKNQTPVFSFLSRGVASLHSKSFFQFQRISTFGFAFSKTASVSKLPRFSSATFQNSVFEMLQQKTKNQTQNDIQKRTTSSSVLANLYFDELKEIQSQFPSKKMNEKPLVGNSSTKSRFQNRRPLQFAFGSSVFKDFRKVSSSELELVLKTPFLKFVTPSPIFEREKLFHHRDDQEGMFASKLANITEGKNSKIIIHGSKFLLKAPQYSKQQAIRGQKTYSVGLYIPVELVENLGSSKLGFSNPESSDFFPSVMEVSLFQNSVLKSRNQDSKQNQKTGQNQTFFQTQVDSSTKNSENSNVFALSNKTSEFHERNKNNPRHVVGGLGFTSLAQHTPTEIFEQTSRDKLQNFKPRWFYFGEIPLMTERGSFLINGTPRVLVNQIIRCPSVYFKLKLDSKNRRSFIASFLSEYGSWLRLETDRLRSRIWVRIDKSPRFPLDWLLSALGWSSDQTRFQNSVGIGASFIRGSLFAKGEKTVPRFGKTESTHQEATQLIWKKCNPSRWTSFIGCYSFFYTKFFHPRRYSLGNLGRLSLNKRLGRRRDCEIPTLTPEDIFLALDYLIQLQNGNESAKFYLDDIDHLRNRRVRLPGEIIQNQFRLALSRLSGVVLNSLNSRTKTQGTSFQNVVLKIQPFENSTAFQNVVLKEPRPISLDSKEGSDPDPTLFGIQGTKGSVFSTFQNSVLKSGEKTFQGTNSVANPVNNPFESESKPKKSPIQGSTIAQIFGGSPPQSFVGTLRELFNTSQLSQYMDQTNPLAEITHKRRLTSLGPGGVGRDQAGFAVREIHPSHFGRICPIETPEGQNAGLVGSLASYARINADGFLQSPAMSLISATRGDEVFSPKEKRLSKEKRIDTKPIYLFSAEAEDEIYLCTADIGAVTARSRIPLESVTESVTESPIFEAFNLKAKVNQADEPVPIRFKQEFIATSGKKIQYTGICPIQMISVATSLIPFLEHDDANRALMGSNMQRQAVPLIFPEKAFVGTGLEMQAARDSSTPLISSVSGQVQFVDATRIEIRHESNQSKSFDLLTYARSNQSTSIHHRPAVQLNEWIEKGDILADGSATHDGELSLGKNLLLAYMPWEGYNFEDAIVINERLVYDDVYTSLHVERYEVDIRNAQPLRLESEFQSGTVSSSELVESITSFESGAELKPERPDLATKPLNQTSSKQNLTMMEIGKEYITRDLDLVFGGRPASRSSDASLVESVTESPILKTEFLKQVQDLTPNQDRSASRNFSSQICNLDAEGIIQPGTWVKEGDILVGKITPTQRTKISSGQSPPEYRLLVAIFADGASKIESSFNIRFKNTSFKAGIGVKGRVIDCIIPWRPASSTSFQNAVLKTSLQSVTESPIFAHSRSANQQRKSAPIQIFLAHKKRIQLGDKMSGRHGNKGIVSLILPPHDMPYTQDGKPIDVVLNPLGVPSRMNVGQVLESLLGLVSAASHEIYRLMPFDEMYGSSKSPSVMKIPQEKEVLETAFTRPETSRSIVYSKLQTTRNLLGKAAERYLDPNNPGKTQLFDGRTGEVFHQPALLGYSYMFKLIHLVDDKIHARSTGPYSLVTQQPLGGRSKKGGQRLGEMEVWALQGFGAAYILQEFLTVKSDEIYSRNTFLLDLMKRKTEESKASLIPTMMSPSTSFQNCVLKSQSLFSEEKTTSQSDPNLVAEPQFLGILKVSDTLNSGERALSSRIKSENNLWSESGSSSTALSNAAELNFVTNKKQSEVTDSKHLQHSRAESPRMSRKLRPTNESRVPESFRVLVNELQALCLSVYYNPDFRLSYPSLLGWDGVFLLASKKFPTSSELSQIKNIGF